MSRSYVVFGSDDKLNWETLNTVEASSPEQAMGKAREQEAHNHYAAVPERNWTVGTPEVIERAPVVKWQSDTPKQMTVDDAIEKPKEKPKDGQSRVEEMLAKAEAISEPEPAESRRGVL